MIRTDESMNPFVSLTPIQKKAFEQVVALRAITRNLGTITTAAQNTVLRSLSPADLVMVAWALQKAVNQ